MIKLSIQAYLRQTKIKCNLKRLLVFSQRTDIWLCFLFGVNLVLLYILGEDLRNLGNMGNMFLEPIWISGTYTKIRVNLYQMCPTHLPICLFPPIIGKLSFMFVPPY